MKKKTNISIYRRGLGQIPLFSDGMKLWLNKSEDSSWNFSAISIFELGSGGEHL